MIRAATRAGVAGRSLLCLLLVLVPGAGAALEQQRSGGWRLAGESSPYLRMHAGNPVQWYPWGEEALELAARENRPLFISIGYFTCHWCHVMARESFENPVVAALLNRHFVAIKIDREQRPDLDAAYMEYVQLTHGSGGWPLSVWALPDGSPFLGGIYFPPQASAGYPGFSALLERLAELWAGNEAEVRATGARAVDMLRRLHRPVAPVAQLDAAPLVAARTAVAGSHDELQGGFSPAPKFPQPALLLWLLDDGDPASAGMALQTLDHILAGGIHDQLAGGFHRYATDYAWRVPHFEKMLYDQALLAQVCLAAWQKTRRAAHEQCVRHTLDFTLKSMRDPGGGFHSALAADSAAGHGAGVEEGAYYTWTLEQLHDAIEDRMLREWATARFGVEPHGNALSDPAGELQGRNVLWRALDEAQLAARFDVDEATAQARNARVDSLLLRARGARPAVPVDDKVIAEWNGYLITALARAGAALREPRYLEAAGAAADFLLTRLYDADSGTLYRDWRAGVRGVAGFNADYAALAQGLLALYAAGGERRYLLQARRLVDAQLERFLDRDTGGFFSATGQAPLWVRDKSLDDGATLSGNGLTLQVLLELAELTGAEDYRNAALGTAAWAAARLADAPEAMPSVLLAWPRLLRLQSRPAPSGA